MVPEINLRPTRKIVIKSSGGEVLADMGCPLVATDQPECSHPDCKFAVREECERRPRSEKVQTCQFCDPRAGNLNKMAG